MRRAIVILFLSSCKTTNMRKYNYRVVQREDGKYKIQYQKLHPRAVTWWEINKTDKYKKYKSHPHILELEKERFSKARAIRTATRLYNLQKKKEEKTVLEVRTSKK